MIRVKCWLNERVRCVDHALDPDSVHTTEVFITSKVMYY